MAGTGISAFFFQEGGGLLGTPLLGGQNSPYIVFSILGVLMETILMMAVYSLVIPKKYEKK